MGKVPGVKCMSMGVADITDTEIRGSVRYS